MADDLTLIMDSASVGGWTKIRVTRGIERLPSDFEIEMTDKYPDDLEQISIIPGESCSVAIGTDVVLTGYVDRVIPGFDRKSHRIRVVGRGKCQDLVDCSAEWEGGQISGSNALQIAQKLAAPYGITVTSDGNDGPSIPQINLMIGETAFEVIERISRYAGLLAYDLPDGNLRLARAGVDSHSSGLAQGQNIEEAEFEWSTDLRYSEIDAYLLTMQTMGDAGANLVPVATATDATVDRHRKLYIVSEQVQAGRNIAQERANWEAARRAGRSQMVHARVDSWRDGDGMLWTPNTLVPVALPFLKIPEETFMLISEVTYLLDDDGTHAQLVLMPPDAFKPEPTILQPLSPDVVIGAPNAP
ncbi:phage baseplate assembly protein [Paraburkholderia xenovorans]